MVFSTFTTKILQLSASSLAVRHYPKLRHIIDRHTFDSGSNFRGRQVESMIDSRHSDSIPCSQRHGIQEPILKTKDHHAPSAIPPFEVIAATWIRLGDNDASSSSSQYRE